MRKLTFHIAARRSRREQARKLAEDLQKMGHAISSGWLQVQDGRREAFKEMAGAVMDGAAIDLKEKLAAFREQQAAEAIDDVHRSDVVVLFTDDGEHNFRLVQVGYALATGKRIYIVGPNNNLICDHPKTIYIESATALIQDLHERAECNCPKQMAAHGVVPPEVVERAAELFRKHMGEFGAKANG